MAQFAKLSIFGTVFEVTTRYVARHDLTLDMAQEKKKYWNALVDLNFGLSFNPISYVDLQPVGMGAFGLVW